MRQDPEGESPQDVLPQDVSDGAGRVSRYDGAMEGSRDTEPSLARSYDDWGGDGGERMGEAGRQRAPICGAVGWTGSFLFPELLSP